MMANREVKQEHEYQKFIAVSLFREEKGCCCWKWAGGLLEAIFYFLIWVAITQLFVL